MKDTSERGPAEIQPSGYESWNSAVAGYFFDGRWLGRPVYLDLEPEALREIALKAGEPGDPEAALTNAVMETLELSTPGTNVFRLHREGYRAWMSSEDAGAPPPFLALLAFFSLVAEQMRSDDEFRANNFYGRLAQALRIEDPSLKNKLQRDYQKIGGLLWDGLNRLADA